MVWLSCVEEFWEPDHIVLKFACPPPCLSPNRNRADDYRLFVGDLGNEVTDDNLAGAFRKYTSFAKAKIIREKWNKKSKGYGFVSFLDG